MARLVTDPEIVLVNSNLWKPGVMPLALDYLGAALEQQGISYDILDLCLAHNPAKKIRDFFASCSPKIVGISFRNLDDILHGISFLDDLRNVVNGVKSATPSSTIVLGGSGFSIAPEKILEYCEVELGVWGEGEEALPLLYKHLNDTAAYSSIPGLVYRSDNGFKRNPQGAMSMDSFSPAGTSRMSLKAYTLNGRSVGTVGLQTKRGCPNCCTYCVVPNAEGICRRLRPASVVVDEIEDAIAKGAHSFFFADSEFNDPPDHAIGICEEIIRRGTEKKMSWSAYIACNGFSSELATLMKRAGCNLAICDFDTASDSILEKVGKRHRQADIHATILAARETDLPITYSLLIGGPGETIDTLQKTTEFLRGNNVKCVTVTEPAGIRIYPETALADQVYREGFESKNPNLWGAIKGNDDLLLPVFYISAELGPLRQMITGLRSVSRTYYKVFSINRSGIFRNRWHIWQ